MAVERPRRGSNALLGIILIALGILFLLGQVINFDLSSISWPLYIIVPGILLMIAGLAAHHAGLAFLIPGTMATITGAILWYQDVNGAYQSWAYAWTLIVPTGLGLAMIIYGLWTRQPDLLKRGVNLTVIGLVMFAIGWAFFEGIINLSGLGASNLVRLIGPVLLIGLGIYLFLRQSGQLPGGRGPSSTMPR